MQVYEKCNVCGEKPSFTISRKFPLNSKNEILSAQNNAYFGDLKTKSLKENIAFCLKCRLAYRKTFFNSAELTKIYNEIYPRMEKKLESFSGYVYNDKEYLDKFSDKLFNVVKTIEKRFDKKIKTIYDIGGRNGFAMSKLANSGYDCTLFDPFEGDACQSNIKKKNLYLGEISEEKSADMVFLCDVLSHCVNPSVDLKKCWKIMEDNSFLFVEVPYDLGTVLSWMIKRWRSQDLHVEKTHFIFYSMRSMIYLLESNGFEIISSRFTKLPKYNNLLISVVAKKKEKVNKGSHRNRSFFFDWIVTKFWQKFLKNT